MGNPPQKFFLALKAFVRHNGKILILRESSKYSDGTNASHYEVPGGRMEPGELWSDVLPREVMEETGLTVTIGQPFMMDEWRPVVREEQWQVVAVYFVVDANTDQVELSQDHDDYQWIDPVEYTKYPVIPNTAKVFDAYIQTLEKK